MMFECEFCNKQFNRKMSLLRHNQSAMYCLTIRGQSNCHVCLTCNKNFKSEKWFEKHSLNCLQNLNTKKVNTENKILKTENKILKTENTKYIQECLRLNKIEIGNLKNKATRLETENASYKKKHESKVELGKVELGKVELGKVELGKVELGKVELGKVELGKVELGKENSPAGLNNIYESRIQVLNDRLKCHECSIFDTNVDVCPVEFFGKDVIYFLRYKIPEQLLTTYSSIYPNITNKKFACIEFGITSNLEQRLPSHKRDRLKEEVIFIHAFKLDKRYTASKVEYYVKTIAKQLGVNFEYERSKESILVDEDTFNTILNRIREGVERIETCADIEVDDSIEKIQKLNTSLELRRLELTHELKKQKIETATQLLKNDKISFEQYMEMLK